MKDTADIRLLSRTFILGAGLYLLLALTGIAGPFWCLIGLAYFFVVFAYVQLGLALHRRLEGSDGGLLYAA